MKILKNNYSTVDTETANLNPYPRKIVCANCQSELEYDETDLRIGEYGCAYLDCPLCGYDIMLEDDEHSITLTKDNIEFPVHFHHVSKETGAVDCCNANEIRERIQKAIKYFRENKDEYEWHSWSGNLYVMVHRWSGDEMYEVVLSNDFYCMEIPFESEDY